MTPFALKCVCFWLHCYIRAQVTRLCLSYESVFHTAIRHFPTASHSNTAESLFFAFMAGRLRRCGFPLYGDTGDVTPRPYRCAFKQQPFHVLLSEEVDIRREALNDAEDIRGIAPCIHAVRLIDVEGAVVPCGVPLIPPREQADRV